MVGRKADECAGEVKWGNCSISGEGSSAAEPQEGRERGARNSAASLSCSLVTTASE